MSVVIKDLCFGVVIACWWCICVLHQRSGVSNNPNNTNNTNNPITLLTLIYMLHQRHGVPDIHRFAAERGGLTVWVNEDSLEKGEIDLSRERGK